MVTYTSLFLQKYCKGLLSSPVLCRPQNRIILFRLLSWLICCQALCLCEPYVFLYVNSRVRTVLNKQICKELAQASLAQGCRTMNELYAECCLSPSAPWLLWRFHQKKRLRSIWPDKDLRTHPKLLSLFLIVYDALVRICLLISMLLGCSMECAELQILLRLTLGLLLGLVQFLLELMLMKLLSMYLLCLLFLFLNLVCGISEHLMN